MGDLLRTICKCGQELEFNIDKAINLYHCGENRITFSKDVLLECTHCSKTYQALKGQPFSIRCSCRGSVYNVRILGDEVEAEQELDPDVAVIYDEKVTIAQLKSFIKLKNLDVTTTGKTVRILQGDVIDAWEALSEIEPDE